MEGSPAAQPSLEAGDDKPRAPNLFVRVGQVFFSPGALFESLKARVKRIAAPSSSMG